MIQVHGLVSRKGGMEGRSRKEGAEETEQDNQTLVEMPSEKF